MLLVVVSALLFSSLSAFPNIISIGVVIDSQYKDMNLLLDYAVQFYNTNALMKFMQRQYKLDATIVVINYTSDFYVMSRVLCRHFSNGFHAIIAVTSKDNSIRVLNSIVNIFEIPLVTTFTPFISSDYIINMEPFYHRPIIDVVQYYKGKDIIYLYDSKSGLKRVQFMFDEMRYYNTIRLIRFINELEIDNLFTDLQNLVKIKMEHDNDDDDDDDDDEGKFFLVLDCHTELSLKILTEFAHTKRLNRQMFHFLITDNLCNFNWTSQFYPITCITSWIDNWPQSGKFKISSTLGALLSDAVSLLVRGFDHFLEIQSEESLAFTHHTLECGFQRANANRWHHGTKLMRILSNKVKFTGVTGHVSFDSNRNRKNSSIYVMEAIDGEDQVVQVASWNEKEGFLTSNKSAMKKDDRKSVYIVTTILEDPYLMRRKPKPGETLDGNDQYEGYCKELAEKIAEIVNITYEFKLVNDSRYGAPDPHSPLGWDGMVGELLSNEAQLAIAPLTITSARERKIAFTKPFMTLGISVMMQKPVKRNKGIFIFMKPLSMEIWMCIVFAYVAVSVTLFFITHFSFYECFNNDNSLHPRISISESLWFSFAALVQQGSEILPRCLSGRIVVSVWWFFALIVVSSFTANLAAFLTVERMVALINSAQDLAKQHEVEYGFIKQGSTQEFFKNSQNPVYQKMWEFIKLRKDKVLVSTNDEGARLVQSSGGLYAFLMESVKNDYLNQRLPCNTVKVGPNLDTKGYGIATPHNSPLRQDLNLAVLQLLEDGTLDEMYTKWWLDTGECKHVENELNYNELSLTNVAGIFYFLTGGLVIAVSIAFIEYVFK